MKMYILIFAVFLTLPVFAQTDVAGKIGHSDVMEVAGATAKTLSARATAFMESKRIESRTIGNAVSGIGTLTVAYTSVKKGPETGNVKFGMKITIKDGKYKIDLTDFKHEGIQGKSSGGSVDLAQPECGETHITKASWITIKAETQSKMKAFVQELKTKMDNPAKAAPANNDF
jgi:hypothetical protein